MTRRKQLSRQRLNYVHPAHIAAFSSISTVVLLASAVGTSTAAPGKKNSDQVELTAPAGKEHPGKKGGKKATPAPVESPSPTATATPTKTASPTPVDSAARLVNFAPTSFLYQPITEAPVDSKGPAMIDRLVSTVKNSWGGVAALNVDQYNTSFHRVSATTPRYDMQFNDCQNKGYLHPDFAAALKNVPIPDHAQPANGGDKNLTIYDPESDSLWEFWIAEKTSTGWQACWGGKLTNVSSNPGFFTDWNGASATGISFAGSTISIAEAQNLKIDHAMYLSIQDAKINTDFSWPAQRSDGHVRAKDALPEGRRLRLDPSLDVTTLGLTPFATAVAQAAQTYGFVVADKGGGVAVIVEDGRAHQAKTGQDPWASVFGNVPSYKQLENFPWDKLQVLPHDYGKN